MTNNFFCPLPWNHLLFKNGGKVQACCESYRDQFAPEKTIRATANNKIMRKLRLELLEPNTVPDMCWKCETREKYQDGFSVRTNSIDMHKKWTEEYARQMTNADGSVDNFNLEHLDIRWSNLCNYKCRFCGIGSSNLWAKDNDLLHGKGATANAGYDPKSGLQEYDMDWEDLKTHLPYVKYCKLAGGEPTIMPGTYQLLEELIRIENKEVFISLVTNATTIKYGKYNLLELLKHFPYRVRIQLSMEGMGDRHAWARSGKDDWDQIAKNIDLFTQHAKENKWGLNFHSGISWMNMYHLADFILKYPYTQFTLNMVTDPATMSLTNFYKDELEKCSKFYANKIDENKDNTLYVRKHLAKVKNAIDKALETSNETIDIDEFKRIHNLLDNSRNQSFVKAYPEWSHLYA